MSKLTKIFTPAIAIAISLGAASPVLAHDNGNSRNETRYDNRYDRNQNASIRSDINDLRRDIDKAAARRMISKREADGLRRDASNVQRLYADYSRNGLSAREVQTLRAKVDRIHFALKDERRDRDGRRG